MTPRERDLLALGAFIANPALETRLASPDLDACRAHIAQGREARAKGDHAALQQHIAAVRHALDLKGGHAAEEITRAARMEAERQRALHLLTQVRFAVAGGFLPEAAKRAAELATLLGELGSSADAMPMQRALGPPPPSASPRPAQHDGDTPATPRPPSAKIEQATAAG